MKDNSLERLSKDYIHTLSVDNYSDMTIKHVTHHLRVFLKYVSKYHNITFPKQLNKIYIQGYVSYVKKLKNKFTKKPLVNTTIFSMLKNVKNFCDYLLLNDHLYMDFSAVLEYPLKGNKIPKNILTESQMKEVLSSPNEKTYLGFRDKVIFELMYSTGLRRMEVAALDIYDLNFDEKSIFVSQGKYKKDRMVPMTRYMEKYLNVYIESVRPVLMKESGETRLFCNNTGRRISPGNLNSLMQRYQKRVNFTFNCHTFRHSMATHLLKHGADILYIQQILGHQLASTTEVYTRVFPLDLKRIILEMHPRSNKRIAEEELKIPTKRKSTPQKFSNGESQKRMIKWET